MRIISGALRGRILKTVEGPGYRPAMSRVREALFSMLEARGVVWSTSSALDLFAGSGSLAFECLSRGAQEAVLVESSAQAVKCLQQNATALGLSESTCRIRHEDVLKVLGKRSSQKFDVVFIDPPYGKNLLPATLTALMRQGWVQEEGIITAEIETAVKFDSEKAHPQLEVLTERNFGQTRVIIWQVVTSV